MSLLCNINMGFVCVEGSWRFSCIISSVIQLDYVVGSYDNWFFGVFSRFCSVTFLGFIILLARNSVSYISWPRRHSIG